MWMERAAESLFFYSAAAEGFGSWCCVDYGYDVLYLDHPEKNRSQQHTGLVSDSKAKVYGFAFGFCSPPCFPQNHQLHKYNDIPSHIFEQAPLSAQFCFLPCATRQAGLITQMVWSGSFQCRTFRQSDNLALKEGFHSQHPTNPKHKAQTEVSTDKTTILMRWINKPGPSQSG